MCIGKILLEEIVNELNMWYFWEIVMISVMVWEFGGYMDIFILLVEIGEEFFICL